MTSKRIHEKAIHLIFFKIYHTFMQKIRINQGKIKNLRHHIGAKASRYHPNLPRKKARYLSRPITEAKPYGSSPSARKWLHLTLRNRASTLPCSLYAACLMLVSALLFLIAALQLLSLHCIHYSTIFHLVNLYTLTKCASFYRFSDQRSWPCKANNRERPKVSSVLSVGHLPCRQLCLRPPVYQIGSIF